MLAVFLKIRGLINRFFAVRGHAKGINLVYLLFEALFKFALAGSLLSYQFSLMDLQVPLKGCLC